VFDCVAGVRRRMGFPDRPGDVAVFSLEVNVQRMTSKQAILFMAVMIFVLALIVWAMTANQN
jgi:hypothetical protein